MQHHDKQPRDEYGRWAMSERSINSAPPEEPRVESIDAEDETISVPAEARLFTFSLRKLRQQAGDQLPKSAGRREALRFIARREASAIPGFDAAVTDARLLLKTMPPMNAAHSMIREGHSPRAAAAAACHALVAA